MTLPLAVFTTGDPVPGAKAARGDFFRMIIEGVGVDYPGGFSNILSETVLSYQDPGSYSGIIVSGSPARLPDQKEWMLRVEDALRSAHEQKVPILGICFGHQLLGEALGGKVGPNPRGREIGTVPLTFCATDALLDAPSAEPTIVMTHLDSVLELPPGATVLRRTELDPHAALRFSDTTWGVQFHPEMDADIVGHYLRARRADIQAEGLEVDQILESRKASAYGTQLLRAFGQFCLSRDPDQKTP
jgi:GMP synthase (glutamine-hydrolysing)